MIIFHIEEDGFETLRKYLDSINSYFSSYEESEEIIADIEGRIAEIFLERLSDGKQVVSAEDVSDLMKIMGNTSDFEAMEEETDFAHTESTSSQAHSQSGHSSTHSGQSQQESKSSRTWLFVGAGCLVVLLCVLISGAIVFDFLDLYCTGPFEQFFNCPLAVKRSLLQESQNGLVTELIIAKLP